MDDLINGMRISAGALNVFAARVHATAHNVANISTDGFTELDARLADGVNGKGVVLNALLQGGMPAVSAQGKAAASCQGKPSETDLAATMTDLVWNQRCFEANAQTFAAADEMLGYLLKTRA